MSVLLSDVVSGSAVGLRGRLWQLSAAELRAAAVSASAEILRLENLLRSLSARFWLY